LQGVAGYCRMLTGAVGYSVLERVAVGYSEMQHVAASVTLCFTVLQWVAVGCSGLQVGCSLIPRILVAMFRSHARHVLLHDMLDDLLHDVLPYF